MSEALRPFRQEWIDYMATDSPDGYWDAEPRAEAEDRWDRAIAAHDREVMAEALKIAASVLPESTEGVDRAGTSNWTARDRDIYSLAIEEAAGALLFRADRIESQETP